MKNSLSMACRALGLLVIVPGAAHAQAVPDIEGSITQGSQIDDIIRDQDQLGGQLSIGGNEIDGEAGIYVLTVNDIFFVGASAGVGYSSNPLRTIDDVGGSFSAEFAASAGVQTRLAESVDFGARVNVSGIEYSEQFAPSSRSASGVLNIGTAIAGTPLYVGITGFGGYNYDGSFEKGIAFYGASASLSAGFPLGQKTLLRPGLGVTRQWSETEENNSTSAAVSAEVIHAIAPRVTLSASARISRVWYDDFFEDVTFVERRDWQYGAGISGNYRISNALKVGVSVGYEKRDSTFFLSEYESFEASLLLSARLKF